MTSDRGENMSVHLEGKKKSTYSYRNKIIKVIEGKE
jgi:hypothetical protein